MRNDPLLLCLERLTAFYGRPQSGGALTEGLPYTDKGMGVELFQKAAIKAQIKTKISKNKIDQIDEETLPCVLILNDNKACVVFEVKAGKAKIFRASDARNVWVKLDELSCDYSGYMLLTQSFVDRRKDQRHWFWSSVRDNRSIYRKVMVAALLINIFGLVGPLFIMNVYDRVIPNNAFETGWVLAIGAMTVFVFDFMMRTLRGYFIDLAGRRIDVVVGQRIFDHVMNMKMAFRPKSSGAFANMLREFEGVKEFCTSATVTAMIDLPFSLLFIFVIYLLAGNVALVLLAIMALVALVGFLIQIPLKAMMKDTMSSAESKHGLLVETINGLETVKLTRSDAQIRTRYGQYLGHSAQLGQKSRFLSALGVNAATLLQQSASIIIVLFGMYMVKDGTLTMGALIAAVIMGGKAIAPIGQMATLIARFHTVRGSLKTLNNIMAADVDRPEGKQFLNRPDLKGDVEFDRVTFSYPYETRKILDGTSFKIKAGEKVGIVGRIGSGKSTITKLMAGLYDPQDGEIYIDGTDYRQIDPADLRRTIGYIAQDTILFRGSIRENLVAGYLQASEDEILRAAKASGVHDFVSKHPMGYDAPVGERGDGLSGGQKQCVGLARALIANPKIILADEPTNHMDTQAEMNFAKQMQELAQGRTLVLVTHRQHLLQIVDRLIVVEAGQVIADGPRDQVIAALNGHQDATETEKEGK